MAPALATEVICPFCADIHGLESPSTKYGIQTACILRDILIFRGETCAATPSIWIPTMFENLTDKLQRAFKNLRGQGTLTEENIGDALKEIRMALLEADVNFNVVKELIEHIREKALGTEVMTSLSPSEQVIKIVHSELIAILGKDTAKLKFASQPPTVVLMAGLQGSGKTTTSGKLAHWLKQGGHRPMLVSVDVYRPAAREQLKIVAQAVKAHLYEGEVGEANTANV